METTITASTVFSVSFFGMLACFAVALGILLFRLIFWSDRPTESMFLVVAMFAFVGTCLGITAIVEMNQETHAAADSLESEYGITDLTPVNDNTITSCSFSSEASAAEYTWVTADGERERGIFARAERQDGSCDYSLTPDSDS